VTANLTKIIVLVTLAAASGLSHHKLDIEIAAMCIQVEDEFKRAASNPFHTPGSVRLLGGKLSLCCCGTFLLLPLLTGRQLPDVTSEMWQRGLHRESATEL
jgi:hypothetical protein